MNDCNAASLNINVQKRAEAMNNSSTFSLFIAYSCRRKPCTTVMVLLDFFVAWSTCIFVLWKRAA